MEREDEDGLGVFVVFAIIIALGAFLMFWPEIWSVALYLATGYHERRSSAIVRHAAEGRAIEPGDLLLLGVGLVEWVALVVGWLIWRAV